MSTSNTLTTLSSVRGRSRSLVLLLTLLLVPGTAVAADGPRDPRPPRTITVQAWGEVMVEPDLLVTQFSISAQGKEISNLKAQIDDKVRAIKTLLEREQVPKEDVRIMQLSILPQYDWKNGRQLKGYEVRRQIELRLSRLDRFGAILDGAVQAGVNHAGHVQLLSSKQQEMETRAATRAVKAARKKAQHLAKAADAEIKRVLTIQEDGARVHHPVPRHARMEMASADAAPVEQVGRSTVRKSVTVVFELK